MLETTGTNTLCYRVGTVTHSFTVRCSGSLGWVGEYIVVNSGGHLSSNSVRALNTTWLNYSIEVETVIDRTDSPETRVQVYRVPLVRVFTRFVRDNMLCHWFVRDNMLCHWFVRDNRLCHWFVRDNRLCHWHYKHSPTHHHSVPSRLIFSIETETCLPCTECPNLF